MRLTVVAVGKLKEPHWREAAAEYAKRLGAYGRLEVVEVPDRSLAHGAEEAVGPEARAILKALPGDARVVALDENGPERSSTELAAWLDGLMVSGTSHVAFALGGSAGLGADVLAAADERLALSRMTFPHQMARVVLLEQLYRAFRIVRNEPYHL